MSIKKLFEDNKSGKVVGNYLKKTTPSNVDGVESALHLSESIRQQNQFVPSVDYGDPSVFAKFGSAEKYYNNAFTYTVNNYPYDGSGYEKTKFYNDLNPLEKYVFDNKYPKSTGFVEMGTDYGTATSGTSHYFSASKEEYIQIQGGPHSGTTFSTSSYRTNNLEFGGPSGSTVEFFLSKSAIPGGGADVTTQSPKQVILDLWNGAPSGTLASPAGNYGRLRIELSKSQEDRFLLTMVSGASTGVSKKAIGFMTQSIPTTGAISSYITGGWNQYSFVFKTDTATPTIDFYINGECHETGITIAPGATVNGTIDTVTGSLVANLGALRTAPSGADGRESPAVQEGYGKLSGSIDEFRFWKKARNGEEIGRHWFTDVDGGSNKYDANVDLGVYYKFNEGITATSSIDNIVLDYSGRISNGNWVGYTSSLYSPRNTGSAIDLMELTSKVEVPSPIIRASNPLYVENRNEMTTLGQNHDYQNNTWMMNSFPDWIIEGDSNGKELAALTQIMASYFDTLDVQISEMSKIKNIRYLSGSATGSVNEFPHNERLIENLGVEVGTLFQDIGALEDLLKRDEQIVFQQKLETVKNTIFRNIYNNLQDILKTKGTEKAFRNVLRCFGIDESIVSMNVYGNNADYDLETNYRPSLSNKKYADFSGQSDASSSNATVYQYYDSLITGSTGIISGSSAVDDSSDCIELQQSAFTVECEAIFSPKTDGYKFIDPATSVITSSLFGWHSPADLSSSNGGVDTSWTGSAELDWGLQVYAIKSASYYGDSTSNTPALKGAFFQVRNRVGDLVLNSPVFQDVYDNQKWNFGVTVSPTKYPFVTGALGASPGFQDWKHLNDTLATGSAYTLSFYGVNYESGIKRGSFYLTSSFTGSTGIKGGMSYFSGSSTVVNKKRLYAGSHRTNFTGTIIHSSDAKISSLRYWSDKIPTGTIDVHAREVESYGRINPFRQAYSYQSDSPNVFVPKIETLALNWDFANITGSDASGEFKVSDFSSGSNVFEAAERQAGGLRPLSESIRQGALYSKINLAYHPGVGAFFSASGTPVKKEYVYSEKKMLPEYAVGDDMVRVLDSDIRVFDTNLRPTNYYFSAEKSMYQGISRAMLELFASIDELNNLIGEPINKYRASYKSMEKLREIFFRRVGNTPDLQKYVDYYKWIDMSIGQMIQQMFPASARYTSGLRTMVESHMLERPKYQHHFVGPQKYSRNEDGNVNNAGLRTPPIPFPQTSFQAGGVSNKDTIGNYQGFGGLKLAPLPSAPDSAQPQGKHSYWWKNQAERNNITISSSNTGVMATRRAIFEQVKNYPTLSASAYRLDVSRAGAKSLDMGINFSRTNKIITNNPGIIGLSFSSFEEEKFSEDVIIPNLKKARTFSASFSEGGYSGELLTPFTAISSSVTNGYQAELVAKGMTNVDFANLHQLPTALQGPFTHAHVGGVQARKVAPLVTSDRKEQFSLVLDGGFSVATITISSGTPFDTADYNTKNVTLSLSGVNFETELDNTADMDESTESVTGIQDASSVTDVASSLVTSINAGATNQNLRVSAYNLGAVIVITTTIPGPSVNGTSFAGSLIASAFGSTSAFTGGKPPEGTISSISGDNPRGQYTKGLGAQSPVNIANIRTSGTILDTHGSVPLLTGGVSVLGNYSKNYEIVFTQDRAATNMDFAFRVQNYYTSSLASGSMPSAFMTPPLIRNLNRSGTVDYNNPRELGSPRKNKSILVQRFAAPGSKKDSKTQFRDVPSNQFSPNNALPFRNIPVREDLDKALTQHVSWGGFTGSAETIIDAYKITTQGLRTVSALNLLNEGVQRFGFSSGSIYLANAEFANGETLTLEIDGYTYSATCDNTVAPASSNATTIGINGLSSGGGGADDVSLATAILTSINTWTYQGGASVVVPVSVGALLSSPGTFVSVTRLTHGSSADGTTFGGTLVGNGGLTFVAFSADGLQQISGLVLRGFLTGGVNPHSKTQRNTTKRIKLFSNQGSWADNIQSYYTASTFDNAYIVRPIPDADRTKWFISLSGSESSAEPSGGINYEQYVMSGSRYPSNITILSSTLASEAAKAQGGAFFGSSTPSTLNGSEITMEDVNGVSISFEADENEDLSQNTRASSTSYSYGVKSASDTSQVAESLRTAVAAAVANGDCSFESIETVGNGISLKQTVGGTTGNKTITVAGGGGTISVSGFSGGSNSADYSFGTSVFTDINGKQKFLWAKQRGVSPWRQIRAGQSAFGSFQRENNLFEFPPITKPLGAMNRPMLYGEKFEVDSKSEVGTGTRVYTDQAGNSITASYSQKFIEPPVTSKYKPIIQKISSRRGTATKTDYDEKIDITLNYTYGNDIQGFSNPSLNIKLKQNPRFKFGDVRKPYEIIRDNLVQKVPSSTTGINSVKSIFYSETVYPKASNTYLSGTRKRLAFITDFWREDNFVQAVGVYGSPATVFFEDERNLSLVNRQWSRNQMGPIPLRAAARQKNGEGPYYGSFRTSQGYETRWDEQFPTGTLDINTGTLDPTEPFRLGTGSMWPLDSHYFSQATDTSVMPAQGASFNTITYTMPQDPADGTTITRALSPFLAMTTTMPAGELMMPQYGRIMSGTGRFGQISGTAPEPVASLPVSTMGSGGIRYGTSSLNSALYVYSVPSELWVSEYAGSDRKFVAAPRSPGGVYSFPYWSTAYSRKYVDGPRRGTTAPARFPFYKNYDAWAEEVKTSGKDKTIVPEFRISSHLVEMRAKNSALVPLSSSLELTGVYNPLTASVGSSIDAPPSGADSRNPDFMPRYGTSEVMSFLNPFMKKGSADLQVNKNPRQFKIESDATLKLLPYDGFYPVLRSLEIATLFSQSYSEQSQWLPYDNAVGEPALSASGKNPARWRTLLRPFFAPGILYNSIKGGCAVEYPITRANIITGSNGMFLPSFVSSTISQPLAGPLNLQIFGANATSSDGRIPGGRRRRNIGTENTNYNWSDLDVQKFFYNDVIPFEGILKPLKYIGDDREPLQLADVNKVLFQDVTGTVRLTGNRDSGNPADIAVSDDSLYRLAVSNYLAAIPQFFLKEKPEGGFMTKFVAELPRKGQPGPAGIQAADQNEARTVSVNKNNAYVMEIGLRKTDEFNLYNNPYAFGMPTSTGSHDWDILGAASTVANQHLVTASFEQTGGLPPGRSWPEHRGEFAPYTPTYYYGPSIARLTYLPPDSGEMTLSQIFEHITVEYVNENDYYYDFASGSFIDITGGNIATDGMPKYQWNRAWQNRQDLDATIVIDNTFPTEGSDDISPVDPNRWVIMPKWECPIFDHAGEQNALGTTYAYSSSVSPGTFNRYTSGQWHDYGIIPSSSQGVYLYISDVGEDTTEFKLVGNPTGSDPTSGVAVGQGLIRPIKKVSKEVYSSGRKVSSLATLVGFKEEEILPAGEWISSRAKKLGEVGSNGEKTISEAIVAMPFYHDGKTGRTEAMTLRANPSQLGPKIKEFRRAFTKYSFPPSLKKSLWKLLPPNYPSVPDYINPFEGGDPDDYNEMLISKDEISVPVIYLMEHTISLSSQDLADIWQGILPDIGTTMAVDMTSIDHYMPGDDAGPDQKTIFPEILQKELDLGLPTNGHARMDLLDTTIFKDNNAFNPEIKWLIFKVKQQGIPSYSEFVFNEINGGLDARSFNRIFGAISKDLPEDERRRLEKQRSIYTKDLYFSEEYGKGFNSFNWPYDYCSLIESSKITATVGFRPDLSKEVEEVQENLTPTPGAGLLPSPIKAPVVTPDVIPLLRPLQVQSLPTIAPVIAPQVRSVVRPTTPPVRNLTPASMNVAPVARNVAPVARNVRAPATPVAPPRAAPIRNIAPVIRTPRINVSAIGSLGRNRGGGGGGGFNY